MSGLSIRGDARPQRSENKNWLVGISPRRVAIVLLLLLAARQYIKHVPPENTAGFFWDFSNVYSASKAMLAGKDPFQIDNVCRAWIQSPHSRFLAPENREALSVWSPIYPPPSLVMIAPLAAMTPAAAELVWVAIDIALFVLVVKALWSLGELKGLEDRLLLVACMLAAAPVIDIFQSGQMAFPACAGVILAVWAVRSERPILAGVVLGLATAIKFQVAGPFVLFYLFVGRRRTAIAALAVFAAVCAIGIIPLDMHGIPWLQEWTTNAGQSLRPGMGNDPRPGGPFRDDIINVQNWLYALLNNDGMVQLLAMLAFALPATAFVVALRRAGRSADDLLALSCVALLSFLPLYRRLYDATVLALLLTWALAALRTPLRRSALVTLILLAEMLVPIDLVPVALRHVPSLRPLVNSRFWQMFIVPHHAWAILVLAMWSTGLYLALHQRTAVARSTVGNLDKLESPATATG